MDSSSPLFRALIVDTFREDPKLLERFLDRVFNTLNWTITEFGVALKEMLDMRQRAAADAVSQAAWLGGAAGAELLQLLLARGACSGEGGAAALRAAYGAARATGTRSTARRRSCGCASARNPQSLPWAGQRASQV